MHTSTLMSFNIVLPFPFFFNLPNPSFSFTLITPLHLYFIAISFFSTSPLFYSPLPLLCMLLFVAIVEHVKILCWFCYINMLKKCLCDSLLHFMHHQNHLCLFVCAPLFVPTTPPPKKLCILVCLCCKSLLYLMCCQRSNAIDCFGC